jgi:hypothetical protein
MTTNIPMTVEGDDLWVRDVRAGLTTKAVALVDTLGNLVRFVFFLATVTTASASCR